VGTDHCGVLAGVISDGETLPRQELNDVRRAYGLPPVPLTGFVPDVAEPRKQRYWSE
jgi:hypothetical protein